jgi:hypothetical protein
MNSPEPCHVDRHAGLFGCGVGVRLQVLRRCAEGQVWAKNSHGQKKGFVRLRTQFVQLPQRFLDRNAVRVDLIRPLLRLKYIHLTGLTANLAVGQTVHPAARMLPGAGRQQVSLPGIGHFGLRIVVPIRAAAAARMMRHFADGNGGVSVPAKPFRHTRRHGHGIGLHLRRSLKQGGVTGAAVASGQQRAARRSARRRLHEVALECSAGRGQPIDVGRTNVRDAVASEFRSQVVDADQQHIALGLGREQARNRTDGGQSEEQEHAKVRISFHSPAAPVTEATWARAA